MVIQLYIAIKLIELYVVKDEFYCINLYSKNLTKIFDGGGALNFRSIQRCQGKLTTMKSSPSFLPFLSVFSSWVLTLSGSFKHILHTDDCKFYIYWALIQNIYQ